MKILQQEDNQSPTYMRDVYEALIGAEVRVCILGGFIAEGTLESWNGYVLKVVNEEGATYVSRDNIASIIEEL